MDNVYEVFLLGMTDAQLAQRHETPHNALRLPWADT